MSNNTTRSDKAHGGRREGAGRKKGIVAETKRTLAETAREYGPRMLNVLATIADDPEQPASARVSAANHILERGYGKPIQMQDSEAPDRLTLALMEISKRGSAAPISTAKYYQKTDGDDINEMH